MEDVDELELLVERVAGLDVGKAELVACVRVSHPSKPGRRMQVVRAYATTTAELVAMAVWLRQHRVQRVVMESTGDYWKGIYYLLEAEGLDRWLVNAREVKNLPGRAKTDLLTELSRDLEEGYVRRRVRPVRFAACDRRLGDVPRDLSGLVVPRRGGLEATGDLFQPYRLVDGDCALVVPVAAFFAELAACGRAATTQRSYAMDLLRWFRFLWAVEVGWHQATRVRGARFLSVAGSRSSRPGRGGPAGTSRDRARGCAERTR